MLNRIAKFFRFFVDIPTVVIVAVLVLYVHRPLANLFLEKLGPLQKEIGFAGTAYAFIEAVLVNAVTGLILGTVAYWLFRMHRRSDTVGRFKAFDLSNDEKKDWGEVTLKYNLFSSRMIGVMVHDDKRLKLDGKLDRDQYFHGHYWEIGNRARRRLGAFLLELSGDATKYQGRFVFVDPDHREPQKGQVVWERID